MTDCYKNMPKSLRIGCYKFRIEVSEFEDSESDGTFGHMNSASQKIRLRPGMTPQNLANTFIHESIHAMNWVSGAGQYTDNFSNTEEDFTTKIADMMCSFWQDNPKAVIWWEETLNAGINS